MAAPITTVTVIKKFVDKDSGTFFKIEEVVCPTTISGEGSDEIIFHIRPFDGYDLYLDNCYYDTSITLCGKSISQNFRLSVKPKTGY